MQWKRAKAAGFTNGVAWEPLQRDSLTANVETEDVDQKSLLNTYRMLIHLRSANPAIGSGDFLALATGRDDVAAYLRRKGQRSVIVIANLGKSAATGISLTPPQKALPVGSYAVKSLNSSGKAVLSVDPSGTISKLTPLLSLEPLSVLILEVSRRD